MRASSPSVQTPHATKTLLPQTETWRSRPSYKQSALRSILNQHSVTHYPAKLNPTCSLAFSLEAFLVSSCCLEFCSKMPFANRSKNSFSCVPNFLRGCQPRRTMSLVAAYTHWIASNTACVPSLSFFTLSSSFFFPSSFCTMSLSSVSWNFLSRAVLSVRRLSVVTVLSF
jgi:hypothetical protein